MNSQARDLLQRILINQFNISSDLFDWNIPLAELQEDFKILGYLADLEGLIHEELDREVNLIGEINVLIHTPSDILKKINQ